MTDPQPSRERPAAELDSSTASVIRLNDPGDLLETVPYLVGFHPRESLVLLGLRGEHLCVTLRLDLADVTDDSILIEAADIVRRAQGSEVVLIVYHDRLTEAARGEADSVIPGRRLSARAARVLTTLGLRVADAFLVCEGRWWSYSETSTSAPAAVGASAERLAGRRLPGDASTAAAAATFAGLVARPDRGCLDALLEPEPVAVRERLRAVIRAEQEKFGQRILDGQDGQDGQAQRARRSRKRALFAAARARDGLVIASPMIADADLALFAVALDDVAIRDALWLAIDAGRLDGRNLWHLLLRRLPSPYDCAPLFLFGWAHWRAGSGALAGMAADRALRSDPSYRAGELLLGAVRHGLDPFRTPRLRLPKSA